MAVQKGRELGVVGGGEGGGLSGKGANNSTSISVC